MTKTNQAEGALKKYFYSGVGFAAHPKELIQKSVNDLVKQGNLSESEGKRIVSAAVTKLEDKYNQTLHALGAFATMEIEKLNAKISKLEKQLAMKAAASQLRSVKPVAKKVAKALKTKKSVGKKSKKAK